jgi:hypothetical protein
MWTNRVTKEQYVERKINEIIDKATRRNRGTTEEKYLLRDLENIEKIAMSIKGILGNEKESYSEFEVETANLNEFSASIRATKRKRKNARKLKTLVAYIVKHGFVYFTCTPRITVAEYDLLNESGYTMQQEHSLGEERHAYPINRKEFLLKAEEEFGIKK